MMGLFSIDMTDTVDGALDSALSNLKILKGYNVKLEYLIEIAEHDINTAKKRFLAAKQDQNMGVDGENG